MTKRVYTGQFAKVLELTKRMPGVRRWEIVSDKMEAARELYLASKPKYEFYPKRTT